jgi:hypothetical protein
VVEYTAFEKCRYFGYFKNIFIKRVLYKKEVERHCFRQDYRQSNLFRLDIDSQFSACPSREILPVTTLPPA